MYQDIFEPIRVTAMVGGKEVILETGRMANQAHGSVWIQCGGTVVLVTVCSQTLEFDTPLAASPAASSAAKSAVLPSAKPWFPA